MMLATMYDIGDIVYLKTDYDQYERMVTGVRVTPSGVTYELSCGTNTTLHFEIEIVKEKTLA